MQFDESLKMLVAAAFKDKSDVFLQCTIPDFAELFFDDVKTAVLLPGAVRPAVSYRSVSGDIGCAYGIYSEGDNIIADVRALGDEKFRYYLSRNKYLRLIFPFAECADAAEYGHRQEFLWAREYMAEISHFCQLVLIITAASEDVGACFKLYRDNEAVFAGQRDFPDIKIYECSSAMAKFYCTANEIEKFAFGNHVIIFNSRNEASEFCAFLQKRKTDCVYIDGTLTACEMNIRLDSFVSGDVSVLIATKSGISLLPFIDVDKVLFCGVPFSSAHLGRITEACRSNCIKVIFCESDIVRNMKILEYFREKDCDEELYLRRVKKLSEISEIIINEQIKE